jgi:hypothetical protein
MKNMFAYNQFKEAEKDIEAKAPPTIYKYRTWENNFHKKIITETEVWFAHPFTLNDPYDIRPPYNFIVDDIDWDTAKRKITEAGRAREPYLSDEELNDEVEKRMIDIKKAPIDYFQKNRKDYLLDETHYDNIGVLSCCCSYESEAMWAHYGNNHSGFAIGFNTVELARTLECTLGYVNYSNKPIDYYILGNNKGLLRNEIFQKSEKWSYEEELRFITVGIGIFRQRASKYPLTAINEIILGMTTSKQVEEEIIESSKVNLPNIPIYKVETNSDQFGFKKTLLTGTSFPES